MTSRENQQYVGPLPINAGIDHFHIDHNATALPPKPLHNLAIKLCNILRSKQGALWSM